MMGRTVPGETRHSAPVPILVYHGIGDPPPGSAGRSLYVTPRAFARQMALLSTFNIRGVSMGEAIPYLKGERTGRVTVLTFDGGYAENLRTALPILRRHGFRATGYFPSAYLGQFNVWDAGELGVRKPIMDPYQVMAWRAAGMEVGAHSRTHPRLTSCSDQRLEEEIGGCKRDLEHLLGEQVRQFCYPYGAHDERVVQAVRRAGFLAACTAARGRVHPGKHDLLRLPRIMVGGRNLPHLFALKLFTGYEDRRSR